VETNEVATPQWGPEEIKQIRDEFFRHRAAHCPQDGAKLVIELDMTTSASRIAIAVCPNCQRKAAGF